MNELPPKGCSIERLITRPQTIEQALSGQKTAQRRNDRYADLGETWQLGDRRFEITAVYRQALGDMTEDQAHAEGYESLESYQEVMVAMHRGMAWDPRAEVWVHEFRSAR